MKIGTLVKPTYGGEIWIVTKLDSQTGYVVVNGKWLVPVEQLEVLCE